LMRALRYRRPYLRHAGFVFVPRERYPLASADIGD
jgi:hypothetical protein